MESFADRKQFNAKVRIGDTETFMDLILDREDQQVIIESMVDSNFTSLVFTYDEIKTMVSVLASWIDGY